MTFMYEQHIYRPFAEMAALNYSFVHIQNSLTITNSLELLSQKRG